MHVISEKRLREFWDSHPDARTPLRAWCKAAEVAEWEKFADVREAFPHADSVGRCVVLNIGGNKYRLIIIIHYNRGKIYIRHVLTHKEYDEEGWKEDCCS